MRILVALVALCRWRDLLAQELTTSTTGTTQRSNTVKENIADKRLKFVNVIRDDLRRNNDDYTLLEQQNQLAYPAPPAHRPQPQPPAHHPQPQSPAPRPQPQSPAPRPQPQPPAPRPPYRKRMVAPGPRPQPPRLYYGNRRRENGDMDQSIQDDNAFKSYTRSKHYKIDRMNKLKRLLNKDKVQMREVEPIEEDSAINTLPETKPTSPPPAPHPPQPTPSPRSPTTRSKPPPTLVPRTLFTPQRRKTPPPEDTEQVDAPVLRQRSKDRSQSPSPDQLDMAAARNPQITRIRLKGRLCQRSLMNLEGPTYDKLGKEVIPEYQPQNARGRPFHRTRAPGLVLPRCCNCCKKSVLGCQ